VFVWSAYAPRHECSAESVGIFGELLYDFRRERNPVQKTYDELQDFALRYTAAWCSQDAARVAAFFSPYGSLAVNDAAPAVGRSAIQEVARSFMAAFPDLRVILDDVVVEAERAEYHWTLVGMNTGPGGAGRTVRISGTERWKFGADGLIASSEGKFDGSDYQRQLGLGS
jgi:hypothetical protein